ncbi:hypothetical protein C0J50_6959, partial [Silurus asotus]
SVDEGDDVTLSCKYETSNTGTILHWYRQQPKSNPVFLLYINLFGGKTNPIPPRLDAEVDKTNKEVDLIISSAAVSDSDLYYCALRPTVTGNPAALYKNLYTCILNIYFISIFNYILFFTAGGLADKIGPMDEDANTVGKELNTVTLECSYETSSDRIWLQWHKQYPNSTPQFILLKGAK